MSQSVANIIHGPELVNPYEKISIGQFFYDHCLKFKKQICQMDVTTEKSETYEQVNRRSINLAIELKDWGLTKNDVVLSCCTNNSDNIVTNIATLYTGAIITNLDPQLVQRHVTFYLNHLQPKIIFVDMDGLLFIETTVRELKLKSNIVVYGESVRFKTFHELANTGNKDISGFKPVPIGDLKQLGIISLSSGMTGTPKCVSHSHYSYLHMINRFCASGFDCKAVLTTLSFHWQMVLGLLFCSFANGGCHYFTTKPECEQVFKAIEKYQISSMYVSFSMVPKLANFQSTHKFQCLSLKQVLTSGYVLNRIQVHEMAKIFPKSTIMYIYGMTEVGCVTCFDPNTEKHLIRKKPTSVGHISHNLTAKIVDINTKEICGPNRRGELYVKSPSLMSGYYKSYSKEDLYDKDGFFRTGDFLYRDEEDCFYVLERVKEIFVYKGWNVMPSVIEAALMSNPGVYDAVVFGGSPTKDGIPPAACVVLKSNSKLTEKSIAEYVATKVHKNECLDGGVFICKEIPKNITGKVSRKDLQHKFNAETQSTITTHSSYSNR